MAPTPLAITDILDCSGDYPGVSTIYQWKVVRVTPMMENRKYRTSAQQSKGH
jgi:hypothetical protein